MWPAYITESFRTFWCEKGSSMCIYHDDYFSRSIMAYGESNNKDKERKLNKSVFNKKNKNDEIQIRTWLYYSPSTGKLFALYVSYSIHLVKHLNL